MTIGINRTGNYKRHTPLWDQSWSWEMEWLRDAARYNTVGAVIVRGLAAIIADAAIIVAEASLAIARAVMR